MSIHAKRDFSRLDAFLKPLCVRADQESVMIRKSLHHLRTLWGICAAGLMTYSTAVAADERNPADPHLHRVQKGESLHLISLTLYGTGKRWKELAEANGLAHPYLIRVGQKIKIPEAPTLGKEDQDLALLRYWRKRFQLPLEGPAYEHAVALLQGRLKLDVVHQAQEEKMPKVVFGGSELEAEEEDVLLVKEETQAPIIPAPASEPIRAPASVASSTTVESEPIEDLAPPSAFHTEAEAAPFSEEENEEHVSTVVTLVENEKLDQALEVVSSKENRLPSPARSDPNLIWVTGQVAQTIFVTLSAAKEIRASLDFDKASPSDVTIDKLERKIGKNMVCARFPQVDGDKFVRDEGRQIEFEFRCLGYVSGKQI